MKFLENIIQGYLRYKLRTISNKIAAFDANKITDDPRILNYISNKKVRIQLPVSKGRVKYFNKIDNNSDPFVKALFIASKGKNKTTNKKIILNILAEYYKTNQPKNASEWLKLPNKNNKYLMNCEPWATPLPWDIHKLTERKKAVIKWTLEENKREGLNIGIEHGHAHFGPVTKDKLNLEAERLYNLHKSIDDRGYNRKYYKNDDIGATVLINNNNWIWYASPGQHRACVLASLNYEKIPVRIRKLVYRNEVHIWPNVLTGLYTISEALIVFDNIFEGHSYSKY